MIDDDVLHARVPFVARSQQCFALKAGIDGFLDMARRTFCDTSEGGINNMFHFVLSLISFFFYKSVLLV